MATKSPAAHPLPQPVGQHLVERHDIEGDHERAVEIASQVVAVTQYPMEVRRIMDEPPQQM